MAGSAPAPTLVDITAEGWAEVHALEQSLFSHPHSIQQLSQMQGRGYVSIAVKVDGRLAGYAIARAVADQADLLIIAVAADKQRRGLAALMLDGLKERLRAAGVDQLFLEVRASNAPAIAFYQRSGFISQGIRTEYYPLAGQQREDARLFSLPL